ncbi:MAG: hypothetical protein OXN89_23760 [Bryobacterales bacterium]|nr:hypothetical protein [Bryobacterales bacterium]
MRSLPHLPSHACLFSAVRSKRIQRERSDGVFLYLYAEPAVADRKRQAHLSGIREARTGLVTGLESSVIEALLALIRNPNSSPAQLARRLRCHSPPIRLDQITTVVQRFDLEQVVEKGALQPARQAGRQGEHVAGIHCAQLTGPLSRPALRASRRTR